MVLVVKNLPAMQKTQLRSLGSEDPLEKGMATHSYSCLGNPMDRTACQATVHGGHKESDTTERLTLSSFTFLYDTYVFPFLSEVKYENTQNA